MISVVGLHPHNFSVKLQGGKRASTGFMWTFRISVSFIQHQKRPESYGGSSRLELLWCHMESESLMSRGLLFFFFVPVDSSGITNNSGKFWCGNSSSRKAVFKSCSRADTKYDSLTQKSVWWEKQPAFWVWIQPTSKPSQLWPKC